MTQEALIQPEADRMGHGKLGRVGPGAQSSNQQDPRMSDAAKEAALTWMERAKFSGFPGFMEN